MKTATERTPNKLTHRRGEGNQSEWRHAKQSLSINADTLIDEVFKVIFK